MDAIKLAPLPDRVPVKLTISVSPELNQALSDYADAYAQVYGRAEADGELIPAMLSAFLDSDRSFVRARRAHGRRKAMGGCSR
jgi:hypothetical protein